MRKRQALLSEEQWAVLVPLFPEPKRRRDGRSRPWVSNRACLQGILWVLRTGARWRDMPDEYPDGSTSWRRLRMWEEQGVWLRAWRKLLAQMDERKLVGLGGGISGRDLRHREKRGLGVGKTRRGKGTKCMVVVDGRGVPVGAQLASAQISEHRLAESALEQVKVPRSGRGRPRSSLRRVIADRGYDSDPLRLRLKQRGTELIAPYRSNNCHRRFQDKRKLRRYRKRWKIERTNAWLQNFRRIQVRYDRILAVFQGFFHCACLLITLRHLCN
jgi:transposase